jgi:hypothetical protein
MNRTIELAGKSGVRYRYMHFEDDRSPPPAGANFVVAELTPDGPCVVYVGETDNLANPSWRQAVEEARKLKPAATVLTRLNVTRAVREAERADLVELHHPPMNRPRN